MYAPTRISVYESLSALFVGGETQCVVVIVGPRRSIGDQYKHLVTPQVAPTNTFHMYKDDSHILVYALKSKQKHLKLI